MEKPTMILEGFGGKDIEAQQTPPAPMEHREANCGRRVKEFGRLLRRVASLGKLAGEVDQLHGLAPLLACS